MKYPYSIISRIRWDTDSYETDARIMRDWLYENIGPAYQCWKSRLVDSRVEIQFVHERDAVHFGLVWL